MSQSPGFPSTWVAGAGTDHRVPDIGPAIFPWLLFHELQLNAAQTYLLHQECWEREGQRGLGRERLWVCYGIGFPLSAELAAVGEGGIPPLVHQKLLTGDQSDTAGLLLFPLGFHFCK